MPHITLDQANNIIAAALAEGASLGLKPLSVAVLDAGGHLVAFQRQDGSSTLRPAIACAKASGAIGLGISSRAIGDIAVGRSAFVASLHSIAPHGIVPAPGGVIVVDEHGLPIGAVGVSGDTPDNDEVCALAGIAASNLIAQGQ